MTDFIKLSKKSTPLLGVDISSTSVKIVQLSANQESFTVENYVIRTLPTNAVVEKNISDVNAVGQCIAEAIKIMNPSIKDAAVAVAGSAVITKTIEMNASLNDVEMENQIIVEADQNIPYPLEEVSIDFERQQASATNPGMVEVLLAACRRENVDSRVASLELVGLKAKVVDIEAYAIERAFSLLANQLDIRAEQTVAIVDIGTAVTTLNIVRDNKILYTREQMFGGNQLVEEVQRRLGLNVREAEAVLKRGELSAEDKSEILEPFKESVSQQVSQILQFFFSSSQINEVDHIVLAGGVAAIEGISDLVQESLATPATVANPFAELEINPKINAAMIANDAPSLLIACGLAMRGLS
ncbi:MAG: pilus assembly protein PilM [SAR86 cluster bacterium]|uniref:Pilus assembly protein PilM n=1 Tax=SAR86 cluster bacterium TaxID=2030880 RepID=A0A2A4MLX2_9GAMM|nr:MAG: pilus assembly protein PilM [SAR86 cluster bacterium]